MNHRTNLERVARWLGRGLLALIVLVGLAGAVGCGPRFCKAVSLVPDGQGGAMIDCDGEPWGVGKKFEDQRKCKEPADGR